MPVAFLNDLDPGRPARPTEAVTRELTGFGVVMIDLFVKIGRRPGLKWSRIGRHHGQQRRRSRDGAEGEADGSKRRQVRRGSSPLDDVFFEQQRGRPPGSLTSLVKLALLHGTHVK